MSSILKALKKIESELPQQNEAGLPQINAKRVIQHRVKGTWTFYRFFPILLVIILLISGWFILNQKPQWVRKLFPKAVVLSELDTKTTKQVSIPEHNSPKKSPATPLAQEIETKVVHETPMSSYVSSNIRGEENQNKTHETPTPLSASDMGDGKKNKRHETPTPLSIASNSISANGNETSYSLKSGNPDERAEMKILTSETKADLHEITKNVPNKEKMLLSSSSRLSDKKELPVSHPSSDKNDKELEKNNHRITEQKAQKHKSVEEKRITSNNKPLKEKKEAVQSEKEKLASAPVLSQQAISDSNNETLLFELEDEDTIEIKDSTPALADSEPASIREEESITEKKKEPLPESDGIEEISDSKFKLQALVWSEDSESCFVVINDRIVKEGGFVTDTVIINHIASDYVILQEGTKKWKLNFQIK